MFPNGGALRRYREVAGILGRHGLGVGVGRAGLGRFVPFHRGWFGHERRLLPYTEPEHVRMAMEELGVTAIKLGQILSTRSDLLPPEYIVEFSRLREAVPAVSAAVIREEVAARLGAPVDELFQDFAAEALASASIGQVHAARLHDGTPVAVKVQKPGLAEQIETDIGVLAQLAEQLGRRWAGASRYDLGTLLQEFAWTLRAELDYVREGRNAERFAEQFDGSTLVRVPRVFWDRTGQHVLTMEFMSGIRIDDLAALRAAGIDTRTVANTCARVLLESVFVHGFFHADPHPGNVLVQADGSIVLVDFGMVGELNDELRLALNRLLYGVVRRDPARLLDALLDIGLAVPPEARRAFRRDLTRLLDRYYGVGLREVSVAQLVDDIAATARRHGLAFPAELALLGKTIAMYEGVGRSLDPDFNVAELAEPFVRDSLHALYSPAATLARGARAAADAASLAVEVPGQLRRILRQVEGGDFEVRLRRDEINMALDGFAAIINRLAASIVGAAIIIALAVLMGVYQPPGWQVVTALLFVAGPVAAALVWGWAIFSSRSKQ